MVSTAKEWMQVQWSEKICPYLKTVIRQTQNAEQTLELRLPEEMPDIGRVLSAWGVCMMRSKQWRSEQMNVSGGISASVVYLPEDGSAPRIVEAWLPFQLKWTLPPTQRDGSILVRCHLRELDARTLSARKLMLRANVDVLGEAMESAEAEISVAEEIPEGVELLTQTYPVDLPTETGEKSFRFEDNITLDDPQSRVTCAMDVQVTERSVLGNRAVVRGIGQVTYLYVDAQGQCRSGQQDIPFAQFVDLDREYNRQAQITLSPLLTGLEAERTEDGVRIVCDLTLQYIVRDTLLLTLTQDAYSPKYELDIQTQPLSLPTYLDTHTETIEVPLQFQDGKLIDARFSPEIPQPLRDGAQVRIPLSGTTHILYEDADGSLQSATENWSDERTLPAAEDVTVTSNIVSISRQNGGKRTMLTLELSATATQTIPMITDLTRGEPKQTAQRPSLILRRMNEPSLWALAKANDATVESIRKANALTDEPEQGRMLLIPIAR